MFKRFVARVLIFFQIYSSLFQGIAYGGYGLLENLPIQDEIYLHGGYAKDGGLRLSLWTSTLTSQKTELLKEIEIPTYEEVKARSRTNSRASSPSPALQLPTSNLSPPSISDSLPSQTPPSSFSPLPIKDAQQPTEIFSDQDSMLAALTDQEDMSDEENSAFESEEGILRTPEGAHFNIQGLKIFLSNSGELLVQGKQEDFSHPILLSSDRSIILHEVEAFALKLTSGSIISVGESKIDFLSLEGSADDSTIMAQFLNQGTLTAKSVFLKNLNNANNGRLITDTIEIPEGIFENLGNLRVKEQMTLNAERFTNKGVATIAKLRPSKKITVLENVADALLNFTQPFYIPLCLTVSNSGTIRANIHARGNIVNQGVIEGDFLKTAGILTNRGVMRTRVIKAFGSSFEQEGTLKAQCLDIGKDTHIHTSSTQAMTVTELINSRSLRTWRLEGEVMTPSFSAGGEIELLGTLTTYKFTDISQGLTITKDAIANFKYLRVSDNTNIVNWGSLNILGLEQESNGMCLTNYGQAVVDIGTVSGGCREVMHLQKIYNSLSLTLRGECHWSLGILCNTKPGKLIFEPDLATKARFLQKGVDAEVEETTDLIIENLINSGQITSIQNLRVSVPKLKNTDGRIHGSGKVSIKAIELDNERGSLSGAQGTTVEIESGVFNNRDGEIGVGGKTFISFAQSPQNADLGKIQGQQTFLEDLAGVSDATFNPGELIGIELVRLKAHKMLLPGTKIRTPKLYLNVLDFLIDTKVSARRTILELASSVNLTLTYPYHTVGALEIHTDGIATKEMALQSMLERFGELYEQRPTATHKIEIQAPITAKRGMAIYAPAATFCYGNDALENVYDFLVEKGLLQAYVSAFDIEKGTIATKSMLIHAPLGIHFGRLIQDQSSNIFVTFCSHSQSSFSHNLGGDIVVHKYEVLGRDFTGVYDGRFLLTLPKVVSNETCIQVKKTSELHGLLLNHGNFTTHDLLLNCDSDSRCEASQLKVMGNFSQHGKGSLLLQRHIGRLHWTYHTYGGHRVAHPGQISQFTNSDPASFMVYGGMSQSPESSIVNEASIFYAHKPHPQLQVKSTTFQSSLFQKEYIKEEQRKLAFVGAACNSGRHRHVPGITYPTNSHGGDIRYAMGFLQKTSNFAGAQKVFAPETSYGNGVVIDHQEGQLAIGGNISTPLMLIQASNGQLIIGTQNPFYIEPKDPIRDLMAKGFNSQNIFVTPNIRKLIEQQFSPQYFFKLRERFFFNQRDAQAFYQDVQDDIVICDAERGFKKVNGKLIFSLSPEKLLEVVRRECQETLHRGYFDDHQTIDYEYLKTLHRNTSTYVADHNLLGRSLSQALVLKGDQGIVLPTKPMIFYEEIMDEENLEQLSAKLYIPTAMIDDARGKRGGKIRTHVLAVLPKGMTPLQMLECFNDSPTMQSRLFDFFVNTPLALQMSQSDEDVITASSSSDGQALIPHFSVTVNGEVDVDTLGIVSTSDVKIHGDIQSKRALVASLFGDVVLESLVQRNYLNENFTDTIPLTARISALDTTLDILAKRNVMFLGAQTHSKQRTYVEALANIWDVPVELVSRRVDYYNSEKESTRIKTTNIHPVVSSHSSDGIADFVAPLVLQAGTKTVNARVKANIFEQSDVHDQQMVEIETEKRSKSKLTGKKKKKRISHNSVSSISRGASNAGREFIVMATEHFKAVNPSFTAKRTDITAKKSIQIQAGVNTHQSVTQTSSQGTVWNKWRMTQESHTTYANPRMEGSIYFHTPKATVQRRAGSGPIANITSDVPIDYLDMVDRHDSTSKSHKSLSAGAAMIVRLAVAMVIGNPFAGGGLGSTMANAGFNTLCSDAAVSLIENGGDPGRALQAMGRNGTALNVVKSMAIAGITKELGDALGIKTTPTFDKSGKLVERTFTDYAKTAVLQSAVSTAMTMAVDGVDPGEALKQGVVSAGLNTLASWGAGQVGYLYREEAVNYGVHKVLHGLVGAGLGTGLAALSHQDPRLGAVSGAFSAVLSEMIAEGFNPEEADIKQYRQDNPGKKTEEIRDYFIEKAQATTHWAAFSSAVGAFGIGMDPTIAYAAARNAMDNNYITAAGVFIAYAIATLVEYPQYLRDLETEKAHVALGKMGIRVAEGTAVGVATGAVLGKVFEVCGRFVYSLKEALMLAKANTTVMTQEVAQLFTQFEKHTPQIEQLLMEHAAVSQTAAQASSKMAIIPDRPLSSSFYTSLFRAELRPGVHYPGRDIVHFQEANKQLYCRMQLDTAFAHQMETLYPGITEAIAPGARGAFPINPPTQLSLTWHHNSYESGILELIPRSHHTAKGVVQANLHPDGKGGQQIWGGGRK